MDQNRNFENVKVGDNVVIAGRFTAPDTVGVVEKVTNTCFVVKGLYYYKKDGWQRGGDTWTRSHVRWATEDVLQQMRERETRDIMVRYITMKFDYNNVPTDKLKEVYETIKSYQ